MDNMEASGSFPDINVKNLEADGFLTKYEDFRPGMEESVKDLLMDSILALITGLKSIPESEFQSLSAILEDEPKLYRPIYRSEIKTSLEMAGFINGYCLRYADMCDTRRQAKGRGGHPADMDAALLTMCDLPGVKGKKVLEAVNLGYRMWATLYNDMMYKCSHLDGTSVLALTVPVLESYLLGDTPEETQNAVNLSAMGGAIAVEVRSSKVVTNSKSGATGYAIARALWCHKMSRFLQTPPTMFTGAKGWSRMAAPLDGEFKSYDDEEVYGQTEFKSYPCCNTNQVTTECAAALHDDIGGKVEDIERIHIQVCAKDAPLAIRPGSPRYPTDHPSADHHIQFCTAVGIRYGILAPKHYGVEYLNDGTIRGMIDRTDVSVLSDEDFKALGGRSGAGAVTVYMKDGTIFDERRPVPRGLYEGLNMETRLSRMRETIDSKRDMIEKGYDMDLSRVFETVYNFEEHTGAELIDAVLEETCR